MMSVKKNAGWSLLELVLVMGMSGFILSILWKGYSFYRQSDEALQRHLMEYTEFQFVKSNVLESIRRAGFTPCMPLNSLQRPGNVQTFQILPAGLSLVRMGEPIAEIKLIDSQHFEWPSKQKLDVSETYLIADCYHAETCRIQATSGDVGKKVVLLQTPLHNKWIPPIYFGAWLHEAFTMRLTPKPALMFSAKKTDLLSREIKSFRVKPYFESGATFLEVKMVMQSSKQYQFKTRIRSG